MDLDHDSARSIASQRWFTAHELDFLLQNFHSIGFSLTIDRGTDFPPSGQFYFFPKRNYKTDGYEWVRKKGRDTTREDMVKLSIDGTHVVTGRYTYSLVTPGLCRRTYEHVSNGNTICMVHYRQCPIEEMPKRAAISSAVKVREREEGRTELAGDECFDEKLVEELLECAEYMGLSFAEDSVDVSANSETLPPANDSMETVATDTFSSPARMLQPPVRISIIDFEPRRHFPADPSSLQGGHAGTPIIVCLSGAVSMAEAFTVVFGENEVVAPAHCLSPFTLKCTVPRLQHRFLGSALALRVVGSAGQDITPPSTVPFLFAGSPPSSLDLHGNGQAAAGLTDAMIFSHVRNTAAVAQPLDSLASSAFAVKLEPDSPGAHGCSSQQGMLLPSFPGSFSGRMSSDHNPELGLRFVEKLGSVAAALGGTSAVKRDRDGRMTVGNKAERQPTMANGPLGSGDSGTGHAPWSDGWLDDRALNKLSTSELQDLVDSFIGTYMGQLVQLASVDEELRQELNCLDQSGYALIHYCSMYDLPDLVETLLLKSGTDVNIRSADGLTPLHIAAGSGHEKVVRVLLSVGVDCALLDGDGLSAAQRAATAGHGDLAVFIDGAVGTAEAQPMSRSSRATSLSKEEAPCGSPMESTFDTSYKYASIHQSPLFMRKTFETVESPDSTHADQSRDRVSPRIFASPEHAPSIASTAGLNLLQAALSSLSLTDKCALSLSLGPASSGGSPRASESAMEFDFGLNASNVDSGSKLFEDIDSVFDSQSVLSESDMESLDVAMSMMGPQELEKVESEVKLIQSNVRTWILRKNYTNLRDAARVLQTAWRVKKKDGPSEFTSRGGVLSPANRKKRRTSEPRSEITQGALHDADFGLNLNVGAVESMYRPSGPDNNEKLSSAAATLQAVTRGMLARKTFETAKRQGMASLVIQKSLVNWWMQNKDLVTEKTKVS